MFVNSSGRAKLLCATLIFSLLSLGQAVAEDVPLVDGTLWRKSSQVEKQSYIIGISNLLSVEYAYQNGAKQPPTDKQTIIRRLYEDTDDVTLDEVIARIDQWYTDHPGMISRAVLDVIWVDMVMRKSEE